MSVAASHLSHRIAVCGQTNRTNRPSKLKLLNSLPPEDLSYKNNELSLPDASCSASEASDKGK